MEKLKPVVFLHGAMVEGATYQGLTDRLAKNYQVITPDLPGFGKTPGPPRVWSLAEYAGWVNELLDREKLKNLILIGHSFGGGVAAQVAAINGNVDKLVLIDAAGIPADKSWSHFQRATAEKTVHGWKENKEMTKKIMTDFWTGWVVRHTKELPRMLDVLKLAVTTQTELPKIKVPTLIMWGERDEFFPVRCGEAWQKAIPGSKLVVVPGNHDWVLLKPELFMSTAAEFLS